MAELSVREQMEQMLAGTHVDVVEEESVDEAVEDTTEDDVVEDTDPSSVNDSEDDTTDSDDDSDKGTSEEESNGEEEDAQTTQTDAESDDVEQEDETDVDTKETDTTDEVNYKEFYEKVALAKFTANGREVEGFKNPEDLIRAQQMLHGYSDKMKVFKEYKKFIKPLEERKITQDPEKFSLAMSLLDGDIEAIKKVIKDKGIDPIDLDLEDINYAPNNVLPSSAQLLLDEAMEQAEASGIGDKFNKVLTRDLDDAGFKEFIDNALVRKDLIRHLKDGTYDIVQSEIRTMEALDVDGDLEGMPVLDKYRLAVQRLQQKAPVVPEPKPATTPKVDKAAEEKARLEKEKAAAEFKKKAAEKEAKIAEERKKAANVSKTKTVKQKTEEVKPESLKGDEFRNYFKSMLMS